MLCVNFNMEKKRNRDDSELFGPPAPKKVKKIQIKCVGSSLLRNIVNVCSIKNKFYDKKFIKARLADSKRLVSTKKTNCMSCKVCITHTKPNVFTSENTYFNTNTLTRHADYADCKAAVIADSMSGQFESSVQNVIDAKKPSIMVRVRHSLLNLTGP